jgi:hypothetical protein
MTVASFHGHGPTPVRPFLRARFAQPVVAIAARTRTLAKREVGKRCCATGHAAQIAIVVLWVRLQEKHTGGRNDTGLDC